MCADKIRAQGIVLPALARTDPPNDILPPRSQLTSFAVSRTPNRQANSCGEGVASTPKTIPFVEAFRQRRGKSPILTAQAYDALHVLREAIEKAGTLDPDKLVTVLGKTDYIGAASHLAFDKRHDETFGPGFATGVGIQWQDGKKVGFWPNNWNGVTYQGVKPFKIPPQMMAQKKNGKDS